jgi:hypothetical protein
MMTSIVLGTLGLLMLLGGYAILRKQRSNDVADEWFPDREGSVLHREEEVSTLPVRDEEEQVGLDQRIEEQRATRGIERAALARMVVSRAAELEMDQRKAVAFFEEHGFDAVRDACMHAVEWEWTVCAYGDDVLDRVIESGTNFAFTPELARAIRAVALAERTVRAPRPPERLGMGEDGGQE